MGIPLTILGNLGLPGANSLATNHFYEKYFSKKDIKDFNRFHSYFIDFCKDVNGIMPGKHYSLPSFDEIKDFYTREWNTQNDPEKKKTEFKKFLKNRVGESKVNEKTMIVTGILVPPAAILLKKTTDNMPQVQKFKLHILPNFVFVPGLTMLALVAVRAVRN